MNDKITEIKEMHELEEEMVRKYKFYTPSKEHMQITYLLQLVETHSKALEFYASLWNHDVELEDIGLTSMRLDRGQKAREALSII